MAFPPPQFAGIVYYRCMGKTSRPLTEGTELLYSGITGGARISNSGGPDSYLCLPNEQEYLEVTAGIQGHTCMELNTKQTIIFITTTHLVLYVTQLPEVQQCSSQLPAFVDP